MRLGLGLGLTPAGWTGLPFIVLRVRSVLMTVRSQHITVRGA